MEKFALSLHPEKTRLIEFGRYAPDRRVRRSLAKPETFNEASFSSSGRRNTGPATEPGKCVPGGLSNWLKNTD
jgi:RNA-directed DNA polymerase